MKRVLVFQHVPYEILGTFHPLMKEGFRIRYVNYGRPPYPKVDMLRYDGLIVLGGPMGAYDTEKHPHLLEEIHHIRAAVEQEKPVLGICLGAQLIASTLGAKVYPSGKKEIGWYDIKPTEEGANDPFLKHFGQAQKLFQWHGDTFDLPERAVLLATSPGIHNQAFRYQRTVYGLQFHLEANESLIERWLNVPCHMKEIENSEGKFNFDTIREETKKYGNAQLELAQKTFQQYINLFSTRQRQTVLHSRH